MHTKIYPAIDIINGHCVRLKKGDFNKVTVYDSDPLAVAKSFRDAGAEFLHVVDLDAAKNPENNNRNLIGNIINRSGLKVQTGGGIRSEKDLDALFELGADRLILGSIAVTGRKDVFGWLRKYGGDKLVIGSDVLNGKIATHGWMNISDEDIFTFIETYLSAGATTFLCTDISKDGMMGGSSISLYHEILVKFPEINLIASGGVHDIAEVQKLVDMQMESIIIGKALYEGKILPESLFNGLNHA